MRQDDYYFKLKISECVRANFEFRISIFNSEIEFSISEFKILDF